MIFYRTEPKYSLLFTHELKVESEFFALSGHFFASRLRIVRDKVNLFAELDEFVDDFIVIERVVQPHNS